MSDSQKKQDPFLKQKRMTWNKNLFLIDLAVKGFYQLANKVKWKTIWLLVPKEKYTSPLEKQIRWHFTF